MIRGNDPILLTPGPLTTSLRTKEAMLNDWGSWDAAFNAVTASIRRDLVEIVGGGEGFTCVPLQGSGTFSVEAAIGTVVPRDGKVLVPNNGAYCTRIVRICRYLNRAVVDLPVPEDQPTNGAIVDAALAADPTITYVAQVNWLPVLVSRHSVSRFADLRDPLPSARRSWFCRTGTAR